MIGSAPSMRFESSGIEAFIDFMEVNNSATAQLYYYIPAGVPQLSMKIGASGLVEILTLYEGKAVVNEGGADVDFIVEGLTDPNLLYVNAGDRGEQRGSRHRYCYTNKET